MELNRKDVLKAAAAATSEFVKQLYCGDGADENEPAVTFETTITLLDKDSTPISVIRSTKTSLEPTENFSAADSEKSAAEEAQSEEQEAAAAPGAFRPPFPGFYGYPYAAMPIPADPNAAAMPGAYFGMPFPYAEAAPAAAPAPAAPAASACPEAAQRRLPCRCRPPAGPALRPPWPAPY